MFCVVFAKPKTTSIITYEQAKHIAHTRPTSDPIRSHHSFHFPAQSLWSTDGMLIERVCVFVCICVCNG